MRIEDLSTETSRPPSISDVKNSLQQLYIIATEEDLQQTAEIRYLFDQTVSRYNYKQAIRKLQEIALNNRTKFRNCPPLEIMNILDMWILEKRKIVLKQIDEVMTKMVKASASWRDLGGGWSLYDMLRRVFCDRCVTIEQQYKKLIALHQTNHGPIYYRNFSPEANEELLEDQYPRKYHKITLFAPDMKLEYKDSLFNFGPFQFDLRFPHQHNMSSVCWVDYSSVIALIPFMDATGQYVHPHVASKICLGEGAAGFNFSIEAGEYSTGFDIITSVLTSYGRNPYQEIEAWITGWVRPGRNEEEEYDDENRVTCCCCDQSTYRDDVVWCGYCEEPICEECGYSCSCRNYVFCSSCQEEEGSYCFQCGQALCDNCATQCSKCRENYCVACRSRFAELLPQEWNNEYCFECYIESLNEIERKVYYEKLKKEDRSDFIGYYFGFDQKELEKYCYCFLCRKERREGSSHQKQLERALYRYITNGGIRHTNCGRACPSNT